jgi:hypothetical protein
MEVKRTGSGFRSATLKLTLPVLPTIDDFDHVKGKFRPQVNNFGLTHYLFIEAVLQKTSTTKL